MSRRTVHVSAVAVVAAGILIALGSYSLAGDGVTYYYAPSELAAEDAGDQQVRLGGLVVDGSLRREGASTRFVLTDGVAEVEVHHDGEVRGVFQEGQGALVEGYAQPDGTFASHVVMVQHDNEYGADDAQSGDRADAPVDEAGP